MSCLLVPALHRGVIVLEIQAGRPRLSQVVTASRSHTVGAELRVPRGPQLSAGAPGAAVISDHKLSGFPHTDLFSCSLWGQRSYKGLTGLKSRCGRAGSFWRLQGASALWPFQLLESAAHLGSCPSSSQSSTGQPGVSPVASEVDTSAGKAPEHLSPGRSSWELFPFWGQGLGQLNPLLPRR